MPTKAESTGAESRRTLESPSSDDLRFRVLTALGRGPSPSCGSGDRVRSRSSGESFVRSSLFPGMKGRPGGCDWGAWARGWAMKWSLSCWIPRYLRSRSSVTAAQPPLPLYWKLWKVRVRSAANDGRSWVGLSLE